MIQSALQKSHGRNSANAHFPATAFPRDVQHVCHGAFSILRLPEGMHVSCDSAERAACTRTSSWHLRPIVPTVPLKLRRKMDIGQASSSTKPSDEDCKPFARPRLKRRRLGYVRPAFIAVRQNPAHYVLDFSESSTRIERSVCNLVISDKRSVAVVGLPGCGKTVILRGLAYYPEVHGVFRDGICLVHLGPGVTVEATFTYLFEVMRRLGGSTSAKRIENLLDRKRDYDECMESIQRFLKEKRFLLILDNLCESTPKVLHILSILTMRKHARALGRMTILSSTRSVSIARSFAGASVLQIQLRRPLGDVSRDIFCAHSAFGRSYIDSVCAKKDFPTNFILKKCSGMPLVLAVVGGAIKRLLTTANTEERRNTMWLHYQTYLTSNFDEFGEICGLFKTMDACVRDVSSSRDWNMGVTALDAVCSLALFKKGIWVPLVILQRLWGLDKKEEAVRVVQSLARLCLVLQEMRKGKLGISIPDIVVDYCSHEAKHGKGIRIWHQRLLNSFLITTENGSTEEAIPNHTKVQRSTEEELYLKENVAYHLSQVLSLSEAGSETSPSFLAAASKFFRNHLADDVNGSTEPT